MLAKRHREKQREGRERETHRVDKRQIIYQNGQVLGWEKPFERLRIERNGEKWLSDHPYAPTVISTKG